MNRKRISKDELRMMTKEHNKRMEEVENIVKEHESEYEEVIITYDEDDLRRFMIVSMKKGNKN